MSYISEIHNGNICHIKNDREPNAGACIFPTFPAIPLFFCGLAWLVDIFISTYGIFIMLGFFTMIYVVWTISFISSYKKLKKIKSNKIVPGNTASRRT